jgi:hypothetical protein
LLLLLPHQASRLHQVCAMGSLLAASLRVGL